MSCSTCREFGRPGCPCCAVDDYEVETARCEYCLMHFNMEELTKYDGALACERCIEEEEYEKTQTKKVA